MLKLSFPRLSSLQALGLGLLLINPLGANATESLKPLIQSDLGYQACLDLARQEHKILYENTRYLDDLTGRGKIEYYASTLETLRAKYGNCDDFALFLYSDLRRKGCSTDNLQLVYYAGKRPGLPAHINLRLKPSVKEQKDPNKKSWYFDVSRKEPYSEQEWQIAAYMYQPIQILNEQQWKLLGSGTLLNPNDNPYFAQWRYKEELEQGVQFKEPEPEGFVQKLLVWMAQTYKKVRLGLGLS